MHLALIFVWFILKCSKVLWLLRGNKNRSRGQTAGCCWPLTWRDFQAFSVEPKRLSRRPHCLSCLSIRPGPDLNPFQPLSAHHIQSHIGAGDGETNRQMCLQVDVFKTKTHTNTTITTRHMYMSLSLSHPYTHKHITRPAGLNNRAPSIRTNSHRLTRQVPSLWKPSLETHLALSCLEVFRTQSLPTKNSRLLLLQKKKVEPGKRKQGWQEKSWPMSCKFRVLKISCK